MRYFFDFAELAFEHVRAPWPHEHNSAPPSIEHLDFLEHLPPHPPDRPFKECPLVFVFEDDFAAIPPPPYICTPECNYILCRLSQKIHLKPW